MGGFQFCQKSFFSLRDIVGSGPDFRRIFGAEIESTGFEGFDRDRGVAVIVIPDHIEIIAADVDRQILAPIIRDPFIGDIPVGLEFLDPVGTAAQRRFQGGLGKITGFPVMFRQHRQLADDQGQFPVFARLEGELDGAPVQLFRFGHAAVVKPVKGRPFCEQNVEGPDHVIGGDRFAVVPAGIPAQGEFDPGAVFGGFHGFGQQTVLGKRLVGAGRHQGVVDAADAIGGFALGNEPVEAVISPLRGKARFAALGGVGIDVLEMFEAGPVFWLAVHGDGVTGAGVLG